MQKQPCTMYKPQEIEHRGQSKWTKFLWVDSLGLEMLVFVVVLPCFLPICSSYCINFHNFINSFFKNYFILTIKKTSKLCKSLFNPYLIFDIRQTIRLLCQFRFFLCKDSFNTRKLDIDSTVYSLNTIQFVLILKRFIWLQITGSKRSINTKKPKNF